MEVRLRHSTIELHMRADHQEARALITQHLDDLRQELRDAGLNPTTVDVSGGSGRKSGQAFEAQAHANAPVRGSLLGDGNGPAVPMAARTRPPVTITPDAPLDVRI
jgi:hypothetical protein